MRLLSFLLFLSLPGFRLFTQISGVVHDATSDPLEYVSISLFSQSDSSFMQGTITDSMGQFHIQSTTTRTFYLEAQYLGYEVQLVSDLSAPLSEPIQIILTPISMSLDEVTVSAKRPILKHTKEGMTIDVQQSVMTQGSSVLEILQRTPGVVLDRRNGDIQMNGRSGVTILINGREQRIPVAELLQMLQGMDGQQVAEINLITSPSARYDAEGNAIINIQLESNLAKQTQASVNLNTGRGVGQKLGVGLAGNFAHRKWYGRANVSHQLDHSEDGWHGIGHSIVPILGGKNSFDFLSTTQTRNRNHNIMLTIEHEPSKRSTFGFSWMRSQQGRGIHTDNRAINQFVGDSILHSLIAIKGSAKGITHNLNFHLNHVFSRNTTIQLNTNYIDYQSINNNNINNQYFTKEGRFTQVDNEFYANEFQGSSTTGISLGSVQLDVDNQWNSKIAMQSGIKSTLSKTINTAFIERRQFDEWIEDERTQTNQDILEKILAAYVSMDVSLNTDWSATIGIRYEYWERDFNINELDRQFSKWFPTFYLTRNIDEFHTVTGSYSKRIARPTYADLASFLTYNGPISVFSGNSSLQATISDQVEIAWHKNSKNISLFASREAYPIARYQIVRNQSEDLAVISPQNVDYQNSLGIRTNASWALGDWWSFSAGGSMGKRWFRVVHTEVPKSHSYLAFDANAQTTIQLPTAWSIEISGWYLSQHYNGSIALKSFGMLNAGLRKELDRIGVFQLSVEDILQTMRVQSTIGDLTREALDSYAKVDYRAESARHPIFKISYSRSLGNQQITRSSKSTDQLEELQRINNL